MSNDNQQQKNSTDPELDELLDSALGDFDDTKKPTEPEKDPTDSTSEDRDKDKIVDGITDGAWCTDFLKQTTEQFEKTFKNYLDGDAEESLQKIAETFSSVMANPDANAGEDGLDLEKALSQTLKDLSISPDYLKNPDSAVSEADLASMFGGNSLEESGGDIFPFMQGMMRSLLSKEILYPSLKDLVDKYPDWLDDKKDSLSSSEYDRYSKQLDLMQKVCKELEVEKDSDGEDVKKERFDKILSLMHTMQSFGQPPEDLLGEQPANLQSCCIM